MKRLALILALLLTSTAWAADVRQRQYGCATTVDFQLYKLDASGLRSDAASASGDIKLMKDEGNEANTTANAFTDEGQGYSTTLTATEMSAARLVLYIVDQSSPQVWLDKTINIETVGSALTDGTATAGGASSITLASGSSTTNDFYNGQIICLTAGTGAGQCARITDYVGSTLVATIYTEGGASGVWLTNPSTDTCYTIYTGAPVSSLTAAAVTQIDSGISVSDPWETAVPGSYTAGQAGYKLGNLRSSTR